MGIPTSRTKETGKVSIIPEKCNGCGICVTVCKDSGIVIKDGKAALSGSPIFGCLGCGHCMAICPAGAITISGRCLPLTTCMRCQTVKKRRILSNFRHCSGGGAAFVSSRTGCRR